MPAADPIQRLSELCADVGFELDRVAPSLLARLRLLAEVTETVRDSEGMVARARDVFHYYEATHPNAAFSPAERRIVVLGCLFSDIGKTGPEYADSATQRLVVEMFSVEGVRDDQQPVARFLASHFPDDAPERIRRFQAAGLDPHMPLRAFWNLHTTWTLEITEAGALPPEIVAAAASHHLLENINPHHLVGPDHRFTRPSGDNLAFDRAEKLLLLLDKYDALRRRGHRTHSEAIAWLHQRVTSNPAFEDDTELLTLIDDLDEALRSPQT